MYTGFNFDKYLDVSWDGDPQDDVYLQLLVPQAVTVNELKLNDLYEQLSLF